MIKLNLLWLRNLIILNYITVGISFIFALIVDYQVISFSNIITIILSINTFFIYFIGYMGLKQPQLFIPIDGSITSKKKYQKSKISDDLANRTIGKLTILMEAAKKYLLVPKQRSLTLLAVALEVGFNSKSTFNVVFKKTTNRTTFPV